MGHERAQYECRVAAWWTSGKTGIANSDSSVTAIHFSSPPDGLEGRWTAEELLLGAIAGCFTTTFQTLAGIHQFDFVDLEVGARASVSKVGSAGFFNDISIHPLLSIPEFEDCDRALKLLEAAEAECLICRALDFPIAFEAHVHVSEPEHSL
jgi:organic hydroperoxide reductase OsmC/OhrA